MISKRLKTIPDALSIRFNEKVYQLKNQGRDVITLSLGEAFFSLPKFPISETAFEIGYHYGESKGRPLLRQKIANLYVEKYNAIGLVEDNVLVSAGSKPLIFMAMLAVTDPGGEVIILEPGWLSYAEQARLAGLTPIYAPYEKNCSDLSDLFTSKTSMVILNSPNNPAGVRYEVDSLIQLYKSCVTHGVTLLVDEAYSDFVPERFRSMWGLVSDQSNLIIINSISKNFGMSGWRIGYLISQAEVIGEIVKLNQHLITCASTVLVDYVAEHFEEIEASVQPQIEALIAKRERIVRYISDCGLGTLGGDSTFYIFVDVGSYSGSTFEFATLLLEKEGVAVVPGQAYGDSTENFVRISIGTETEERICSAIDTIARLVRAEEPI